MQSSHKMPVSSDGVRLSDIAQRFDDQKTHQVPDIDVEKIGRKDPIQTAQTRQQDQKLPN
jgi:hypothetical protein